MQESFSVTGFQETINFVLKSLTGKQESSLVRRQHVIILLIHRVLTIGGRMCNPEFAIRKATKTQKSHMGDQTQCLFLRDYQATPTDGCAVSPRLEVQRFFSNGREEVVGQGILKEIKEHRLHIQHITSWVYFNLFCICCEPSTGSTNGCCDSFCTAVHPSDLYDVVRTGISHKAKSPRESYRYKSPIVAIITDIAIILQKLCEWRRKLWCNICSFFSPVSLDLGEILLNLFYEISWNYSCRVQNECMINKIAQHWKYPFGCLLLYNIWKWTVGFCFHPALKKEGWGERKRKKRVLTAVWFF